MTTMAKLEAEILECMESDYAKYKNFIYRSFTKLMENMKKIRLISERILELILENNDIDLLKKYSYYYTFVITQSYSHYVEYAEIHGAHRCSLFLKKLNRRVYFEGRRK
ncbi:hypothetical protein F-VV10_0118 [Faustovirus]|nr:hypothetical protein F-VV10_0118 [Faustovirus]